MTTYVEARERARQRTGRFGVQAHTDPEAVIGSTIPNPGPPFVKANANATVSCVVTPERKGWLRTHPEVVAPVELSHTFQRPSWSMLGERGERIVDGQVHLPLIIDGEPVPADDERLSDLVRRVADTAPPASGTTDRREEVVAHVRKQLRATVIIDGAVWARASQAHNLVSPRT